MVRHNGRKTQVWVVALAMQSYQKAHKLKYKANKRQIKMLQQLDADEDMIEQKKEKNVKNNKKI
jgi:hypothetical protein